MTCAFSSRGDAVVASDTVALAEAESIKDEASSDWVDDSEFEGRVTDETFSLASPGAMWSSLAQSGPVRSGWHPLFEYRIPTSGSFDSLKRSYELADIHAEDDNEGGRIVMTAREEDGGGTLEIRRVNTDAPYLTYPNANGGGNMIQAGLSWAYFNDQGQSEAAPGAPGETKPMTHHPAVTAKIKPPARQSLQGCYGFQALKVQSQPVLVPPASGGQAVGDTSGLRKKLPSLVLDSRWA